jgi:hypothetical protein
MKQLIEDLISAMEYHVEQTRPVHMTTVAIQAAKDALKAMPAAQPAPTVREPVAQNICIECANADSWGLPDKPFCRSCVSNSEWKPLNASSKNPATSPTPQPVPVKTYHDGKPWPVAPKPWVGLTDAEIDECEGLANIRYRKHTASVRGQQLSPADGFLWHCAKAIEAKLKEKNT